MLLDEGADVNAQGRLSGNALNAASAGLDRGANVNIQGDNALQIASAAETIRRSQTLNLKWQSGPGS
jgi:hypothetical protein